MMVRTGLEYLNQLAANAGGDLELQREIAAGYMRIGDAEGNPNRANLGRIEDALASYRKAGELYRQIVAKNAGYFQDLTRYYQQFVGLVRFTSDLKKARELSELSIQAFERLRVHRGFDTSTESDYTAAWCTLGDIDEDMGHYPEAWAEFSRCAELARARLSKNRDTRALEEVRQATSRLATSAQEMGLLTEARQALDESETVIRELLALQPESPPFHRRQALLHQFRSTLYYDDPSPNWGDPARALESAKHYLEGAQKMVTRDPQNAGAQFSRAIAIGRLKGPTLRGLASRGPYSRSISTKGTCSGPPRAIAVFRNGTAVIAQVRIDAAEQQSETLQAALHAAVACECLPQGT